MKSLKDSRKTIWIISFSCFVLGLIAVPLGIQSKDAKRSFGIILGLFVFLARGANSRLILIRTVPAAIVAAALYFTVQTGAAAYFAQQVPPVPNVTALDVFLAALILASFAGVALLQILPAPEKARWYRTAYVHLSNGLYANTLFNRLTGALRRDYAN